MMLIVFFRRRMGEKSIRCHIRCINIHHYNFKSVQAAIAVHTELSNNSNEALHPVLVCALEETQRLHLDGHSRHTCINTTDNHNRNQFLLTAHIGEDLR
jgi:hypothetical protein